MKQQTLWCKNYSLLMLATTMGAIGGIAGSYAMSFLVFDETGSTLAAGFLVAIQILPHFLLPIIVAPWMDRMPRKPFLVGGDLIGGLLYGLAGLYLNRFEFSCPECADYARCSVPDGPYRSWKYTLDPMWLVYFGSTYRKSDKNRRSIQK